MILTTENRTKTVSTYFRVNILPLSDFVNAKYLNGQSYRHECFAISFRYNQKVSTFFRTRQCAKILNGYAKQCEQ